MDNFPNECSPCVPSLGSPALLLAVLSGRLTSFFQSRLSLIKPLRTHAPKHSVSQAFPGVQRFEVTSRETHCKYCNECSFCCEFFPMRKPVRNKLLDCCSLWPQSRSLFPLKLSHFCNSRAELAHGLRVIPRGLGANPSTFYHQQRENIWDSPPNKYPSLRPGSKVGKRLTRAIFP